MRAAVPPDHAAPGDALDVADGRPLIARFEHTYADLGERFRAFQAPARAQAPELVAVNRVLAHELGLSLDALDDAMLAALFSGRILPAGAQPLAMAYAGHQFGNFVPTLGDGRALLLGEVVTADGRRLDIQLKGSGRTPFSRRGDGRAALGPVLREYLVAEGMHALGIPTTRALAATRTGETVLREGPMPGGVLTRVAASHLRVGTFEYFAARRDTDALTQLTRHALQRHYPERMASPLPALALLEGVIERQAALVAQWLLVGFIHGVMNTDNMTLSGETIDYGPCAFMEAYDPATVFSGIDSGGRYAYVNQPAIAHWNLAQLARALLPLLDPDEEIALGRAREALDRFQPQFAGHWLDGMRRKLGFDTAEAGDAELIDDWLALLQAQTVDFTLAFRTLCDAAASDYPHALLAPLFADMRQAGAWLERWETRLQHEVITPAERRSAMQRANPAIIPRNHRVEEALQAAILSHDDGPFLALLDALGRAFDPAPGDAPYTRPARAEERVTRTWCGT
jgi:uncharacterized protein YdiU (UPF0061 family)